MESGALLRQDSPDRDSPEPASPVLEQPEAAAKRFFTAELLPWYAHKKRDLPWRQTRDPYAIWISEAMLQQTQVATVIPYWTRWMDRFPTVGTLATASIEDVLKQWQGLGYYARARNLHRAAQVIVEKYNGTFPETLAEVLRLPGVGRYTAGAICSIAFSQDVPLVDANVVRVLCRYFGLRGDPKSGAVQEKLWRLAEEMIPSGSASSFNQGLMELGALVCLSRQPRCPTCPVQTHCVAWSTGDPESLPEHAARPAFTQQTDVSAIIAHPHNDGRVLIARRFPEGLWGGLYEFPRVTKEPDEPIEQAAERAAREIVGLTVRAEGDARWGIVRHGVTTRRITLVGIGCTVVGEDTPQTIGCSGWEWVELDAVDRFPLSSPQARLAEQLRARQQQPALF